MSDASPQEASGSSRGAAASGSGSRGGSGRSKTGRGGAKKTSATSLQAIAEEGNTPSGSAANAQSSTGLSAAAGGDGGSAVGGEGTQRAPRRTTQQIVEEKVAAAEANMRELLAKQSTELEERLAEKVEEKLHTYQEAVENFAVEERVVTLEHGRPSRVEQEKIVIVVNALQLDEMREALRAHRTHTETAKRIETRMRALEERLAEAEAVAAAASSSAQRARGRAREESVSSGHMTDESEDPDRTLVASSSRRSGQPARKKAKQTVDPGRPDAAAQKAFEALLREGFGISKEDRWPEYPDVPKDSDQWPRHPVEIPELPADHPEANLDPQLRSDPPPRGEPKLRLNWIGGQIDDVEFSGVIKKYAKQIADRPDDFDIPDDERRKHAKIEGACKRTLEHIKRTVRVSLQLDAEELKKKKTKKAKRNRCRTRRATRQKQRMALLGTRPDAVKDAGFDVGAVESMLCVECVEEDETEDEGTEAVVGEKPTKSLRQVIPEWWSAKNRSLQQNLDSLIPAASGSYSIKPVISLRPCTTTLSGKIPRIAVSSRFAEDNPDLVRNVKKNSPPFKPALGAVASSADAWGRPIRGLAVASGSETRGGGAGEADEAGGGGGDAGAGDGEGDGDRGEGSSGGVLGSGTDDEGYC
ncbi:hypothetical protein OC835_000690 [Tilletia horrida]|nr:hypothetical protein OC835_000690 [Tilletia horrida]